MGDLSLDLFCRISGKRLFTILYVISERSRAYSFGHLKSAKSADNGRLRREELQLPKEWEF